jgi:arylamine N-acetyltransferase
MKGCDPDDDRLDPGLRARVLARLGLAAPPGPDLEGLRGAYRAWCLAVPFDNVRKMIALRTSPAAPLPGRDAADFFDAWLAHGTGGTCWPSSNALYVLLRAVGLDARRITASMHDVGVQNHGSVIASTDGREWLVDSSSLTGVPLPLGPDLFVHDDPVLPVEVESIDGTHVVWTRTPPGMEYKPCRLQPTRASHADYLVGYERSRARSVFNHRLFARRNRPGELIVLAGETRHRLTSSGLESQRLAPEEVRDSLRHEIGLSEEIVARWVEAGGLEAVDPPDAPRPPRPARLPPSRRAS